jgi:hypothetical protein
VKTQLPKRALGSILAVLLLACSPTYDPDDVAPPDAVVPERYSSLEEHKQHADIAVVGVISSVGSVTVTPPLPSHPPKSDAYLEIEEVLWARDSSVVERIFSGRPLPGVHLKQLERFDTEVQLALFDELVVFVTEYELEQYRVSGDASGVFRVRDDGQIAPASPYTEGSYPASLEAFAQALK